jgi:hypothetical protein
MQGHPGKVRYLDAESFAENAAVVSQEREREVVRLRPRVIVLRRVGADAKHGSSNVCFTRQ